MHAECKDETCECLLVGFQNCSNSSETRTCVK